MLDNQAIERFGTFQGKRSAQLAVERAQRRHAVNDHAAVLVTMKEFAASGRLRREFAHDLLQDILQGNQSEQLPIFVDDQTESLPVSLELVELGEQRGTGWDEVGRTEDTAQ